LLHYYRRCTVDHSSKCPIGMIPVRPRPGGPQSDDVTSDSLAPVVARCFAKCMSPTSRNHLASRSPSCCSMQVTAFPPAARSVSCPPRVITSSAAPPPPATCVAHSLPGIQAHAFHLP
jgi:hypothetical protein